LRSCNGSGSAWTRRVLSEPHWRKPSQQHCTTRPRNLWSIRL